MVPGAAKTTTPHTPRAVMSMNGFMKKLILIFIVLVAAYTLLRNNVYWVADQIMWSTSYDFVQKTLLPILMIICALLSIFRVDKPAYFKLAIGTMVIDTTSRFFIGVNHLHGYLSYRSIAPLPTAPGSIKIVTNLWPSHIILILEILFIVIAWWLFPSKSKSILDNGS